MNTRNRVNQQNHNQNPQEWVQLKAPFYLITDAHTVRPNIITYEKKEVKNDLPNRFSDTRDGKVYKIVSIGTQTWMAENLAFVPENKKYWAYDNDQSNVTKFGYLYDYENAKYVCPGGWHLPSDKEWERLAEYISSQVARLSRHNGDWKGMGKYLKAKSGWKKKVMEQISLGLMPFQRGIVMLWEHTRGLEKSVTGGRLQAKEGLVHGDAI